MHAGINDYEKKRNPDTNEKSNEGFIQHKRGRGEKEDINKDENYEGRSNKGLVIVNTVNIGSPLKKGGEASPQKEGDINHITQVVRTTSPHSAHIVHPMPHVRTSSSPYFKKEFAIASAKNLHSHINSPNLGERNVVDSINRTTLYTSATTSSFVPDKTAFQFFSSPIESIRSLYNKLLCVYLNNSSKIKQIGKNIAIVLSLSAVAYVLFDYLTKKLPEINFARLPSIDVDAQTLFIIAALSAVVILIAFLIDKIHASVERECRLIALNSVAEIKSFLLEKRGQVFFEENFIEAYCLKNKYDAKDFRNGILPFIKSFLNADKEIEETIMNVDGSAKVIWRYKNISDIV